MAATSEQRPARVQGIETDIGLEGTNFNTAISILFVGYILGQVPSNFLLARSRPSYFISGFVALWGAISACTGAVQNYPQLVVVRFFLGVTEAPFFPGALFLLSAWYTKKELAFRTAIFYTGSLLSGAFSGLISAGIQAGLDGAHGLESWRWLFIIEGAITVFVAFLAGFVLPDYPGTTRWLSLRQKAIAVYRLEADTGISDEGNKLGLWASLVLCFKDMKLHLLALILVTKTTAAAVTQFLPTVVETFGMGKVDTLLLTAPPYVFALLVSLLMSRLSDRKPERCFHLIGPLFFGMAGFIIAVSTLETAPRYFSLFLMLGGLYGSYNIALAWISSTFPRPKEKRAVAYAWINAFANLAQVYSPYLYNKADSPRYQTAFTVNSIMVAVSILLCLALRWVLKRANAKMDQEETDVEGKTTVSTDAKDGRSSLHRIRYVL